MNEVDRLNSVQRHNRYILPQKSTELVVIEFFSAENSSSYRAIYGYVYSRNFTPTHALPQGIRTLARPVVRPICGICCRLCRNDFGKSFFSFIAFFLLAELTIMEVKNWSVAS